MKIRTHRDLDVYKMSLDMAMRIFDVTKTFPPEEKYSLIDQIRRSSRSVCANIAEAFRKRKYPKSFIAKLNDAEGEAAETQVWLEFCLKCKYLAEDRIGDLFQGYENIIGKLVMMSKQPEKWIV
jgi:four helix bundle protein